MRIVRSVLACLAGLLLALWSSASAFAVGGPTLTSPAASVRVNGTISVSYTLPTTPDTGTVAMSFTPSGGGTTISFGLDLESVGSSNDTTLMAANLPASSHVLAPSASAIPDGTYDVALTYDDGDILFAVSTQELDDDTMRLEDLNAVAGELMWDAILASVPHETPFVPPSQRIALSEEQLAAYVGTYSFGPNAHIRISAEDGHLVAEALNHSFQDFARGELVPLRAISDGSFYVDARYKTRISFKRAPDGEVNGATVNPGRWQQTGTRE